MSDTWIARSLKSSTQWNRRLENGPEIKMKNKRNSWDYKKEHIRHKEKKIKYDEAKEE